MVFHKNFNVCVLIFGIFCIVYYVGMGLAVRFGQSLLWLWPLIGFLCIGRYLLVHYTVEKGRAFPLAPRLVRIIRGLLLAALLLFSSVQVLILAGAWEKPEADLDCIIVLGARVNGRKPSGALQQRIDRAADYLRENPDTLCVVSGGQGDDEEISEAACMYEGLVGQGIQGSRILMEDRSTDTLSNIEKSLSLMPENCQRIGIVTNDFHCFRAILTAEQISQHYFCGVPARSTIYGYIHYALREFFALGAGFLSGELRLPL